MKYLVAVLILFASSISHASDCALADTQCKKADRLISLLGYSESIKAIQASCRQTAESFHPHAIRQKDPNLFDGIGEGTPKWQLLVQAFEEYKAEYCGDAINPILLTAYRDAWASSLSPRDLDAALTFVQSPKGRAFGKAIPLVTKAVTASAMSKLDEIGQAAYLQYAKRVREISE